MDRYENPCHLINLLVTSSTSGSEHVSSDASEYGCGVSFGGGFVGGGLTRGGSVGRGLTGGWFVGGGLSGDQSFGLGTWDNISRENDNILPTPPLA